MSRGVGLEVRHHLRQRVLGEPGLRARALEIAVGLVDREGGIPRDAMREHRVEHGGEPRGIGLAPEITGPPEAVELVVVVVRVREGLRSRDRRVRDAVPMLDRANAVARRRERIGLLDLEIGGDRQIERARFLGDRRPDVRPHDEHLESLRPLLLGLAHQPSRIGRRVGRDHRVRDDRRRGDPVLGRRPGVRDHRVDPLERSGIPDGRDAVCEEQLVDVILWHRASGAAELDVRVHVDDPRQHVHPRRVDRAIGLPCGHGTGERAPPALPRRRLEDRDDGAALRW